MKMKYVYRTCPCGEVKGVGAENYNLFKGIPYATANRWEAPVEVTAWEGVHDATRPGKWSCQYDAFLTASNPVKEFYKNETVDKGAIIYGEDSLNLNIWTPVEGENLPVLVYIHGGSYETGGGAGFVGKAYCSRGVVVVTINYRLNAFASAVGDGIKGNFGLQDQACALRWIKHNIAAFGGNPDRVTIMGESAGAMSVQNLILSPLGKDLFCGAIMLSGGGILPDAFRIKGPETAQELWNEVKKAIGVDSLEELKQVSADKVFCAWYSIYTSNPKYACPTTPVIDGDTIPEAPAKLAAEGKINAVPSICSVLSEDMWPLTLYRTAVEWGELMEQTGKPPVYGLYMDHAVPGSDHGAYHGADVKYVFQSFDNCWRPYEEVDYRISNNLIDYITGFVKTGVPAAEGLAEWKPIREGNKQFMHFGDEPCAMVDVPEERLDAFQKLNKPFPGM